MIMFFTAAVLVAIAIGLAVADVFWPFSVAIALSLAVAWWLGHLGAVWAAFNPYYAAAYVVIGFLWVFYRWTRLVEEHFKLYNSRDLKGPVQPPQWSGHSDDFIAYFFYWPIDMVGYVLSEFLIDAWDYISSMVGRSFDKYAEWRFKSLNNGSLNKGNE